MERAIYSDWLEIAKNTTNIKEVSENFLKGEDVFTDISLNLERNIFNKLLDLLEKRGVLYDEAESILLEYGAAIDTIYTEMGIRVGARLEMQLLCNIK